MFQRAPEVEGIAREVEDLNRGASAPRPTVTLVANVALVDDEQAPPCPLVQKRQTLGPEVPVRLERGAEVVDQDSLRGCAGPAHRERIKPALGQAFAIRRHRILERPAVVSRDYSNLIFRIYPNLFYAKYKVI